MRWTRHAPDGRKVSTSDPTAGATLHGELEQPALETGLEVLEFLAERDALVEPLPESLERWAHETLAAERTKPRKPRTHSQAWFAQRVLQAVREYREAYKIMVANLRAGRPQAVLSAHEVCLRQIALAERLRALARFKASAEPAVLSKRRRQHSGPTSAATRSTRCEQRDNEMTETARELLRKLPKYDRGKIFEAAGQQHGVRRKRAINILSKRIPAD